MQIDPQYCSWDTESTLLIFSDNVYGTFVYYSHLLPVVSVVLFSLILLWQNPRDRIVQSLAFISLAFTCWSLTDLALWATAIPDHTMFFWSIILHFELLVYIGSLFFIHFYVLQRAPSTFTNVLILIAYLPLVLFTHTNLNLSGFDYTNCWREAVEGPLVLYVYILEALLAVWILSIGISKGVSNIKKRGEIFIATFGTFLFLISFSLGNILGTFQVDWELGQYGLFSVPLFIGLLAYLVIRYQSINIKLISTQALILGISVLVSSILFLRSLESVRTVTMATVFFVIILGYLLTKSVQREIKQREEIEKLATNLSMANNRLKELDKQKSEFVSIASHQLRSPLTAIRGYVSMLQEGSYGAITTKQAEPLIRVQESAKFMASSIDDFLNVSRIESGNMKYELKDISLPEHTSSVVEDLRSDAIKRGLLLLYRSDIKSRGIINADFGKMQQILHNLINNALKYTPKGTVTVYVHDNLAAKRIYVEIIDTGIGMTKETIYKLFEKFSRAKVASSANIMGTGLGLFVAREMARAMKGDVTAHSDGEGKGSRFVLTLPLV